MVETIELNVEQLKKLLTFGECKVTVGLKEIIIRTNIPIMGQSPLQGLYPTLAKLVAIQKDIPIHRNVIT